MSIKALNWAIELHVGDSLSKLILMAIANYADEHAVAWPSHSRLARDCEMSVATVKRRVAHLEELGVLVTFRCWLDEHGIRNRDGRGRETSREIRLDLSKSDVVADASDDDVEDEGGPTAPPQALGEGAPTAPHGVQSEPPGESLRTPLNEPSLNQESPPSPPPGGVDHDVGSIAEADPEGLAEFRRNYPKPGVWVWSKVDPVWLVLTADERIRCRAAVVPYARETAGGKPAPMRPDSWIKRRMFENYPDAKLPEAPPQKVFVGAEQLVGLDVAYRILGMLPMPRNNDPERGPGIWRTRPIEADLAALTAFANQPTDGWCSVVDGSHEFAAWANRLREWTGFTARATRQWLEEEGPEHRLPAMHPDRRFRKSAMVLRVPSMWPPKKDGTVYGQGNAADGDATQ